MNIEKGLAKGSLAAARKIFDQAIDLAPGEQAAFLDGAVDGDADLRAYVARLLAKAGADEDVDSPLSSPVIVRPPAVPTLLRNPSQDGRPTQGKPGSREPLPEFIGPYRVLRLISAGGMGVVYEAQQDNPRRTVAVKVIRGELFADSSLPRFKQEAHILARLQHPGIARVYEAGVDDGGQPYFAMELIQGEPLDTYVRGHKIDAKGRLSLIADVCDAVQHAHDRGIIHRDLKPGNILVDETGKPKIVDFGIARATDSDLITTRAQTEAGQLIGTLSYMSPEQLMANPAELDHRLDVYALGVILYELLADRLPCHLEHLPIHEVARAIMEEEPARLGSINRLYRGDVEIIVAKALAKEKERRYATAAALADDIRRCLNQQPIQARAPSMLYQMHKFARRNKALVGGVTGILLALCCGAVGMMVFAFSEAEQHRRADANARTADANARTADANARDANIEKQHALNEAYRSRIAAALAALQSHDVAEAALQLADAPESLRGWEWRYLHSRLDESAAVLDPAGEANVRLVPTADGVLVVSTSAARLRVRDLEGREHLSLPWDPGLRFWNYFDTPQGIRYMAGKEDSHLGLFDDAGKELAKLAWKPNADSFLGAVPVMQPDLKRIAVVWMHDYENYRIEICDAANGTCVARCTGHTNSIRVLALNADGSLLASGGEDGVARLWDMATGACLAECRGYKSRINCLAFRPDGACLLTGTADGMIRQWDTRTGKEIAAPLERPGEVNSVVYSPNGLWIASSGSDRTIRLWQVTERREIGILHGHTGEIKQLAFTPDGRRLVSLSPHSSTGDGSVRVWDVDYGASLPVLRGHTSYVYPVAYSPDDQWIASGSWDGTVRLWDARTGEACAKLPIGNNVRSLAFTPDGSRLVIGCDGRERVQIWNTATAQRCGVIPIPANKSLDRMQGIAVRADGAHIAAVSQGGNLMIANLTTGESIAIKSFREGYWEKNPVAYSPDGKWLACTDPASHICILETTHYEVVKTFAGHTANVYSIAWSRDGRQLVSGSADRTVRVWNADTGQCVQKLEGHTDEVYAVAFHPDGTRIASASRNAAIGLWDTASGKQLLRLKGHTSYVYSLTFSRDGSTLASGSGDGTVRFWDTEPVAKRIKAKHDAEVLRPEAEKRVALLFANQADAEQVVAAIRADTALNESQRHAALSAVLRRQARP